MAATIALLANKGELVDSERKVGRANDRDVGGIDKTGIRLEHRDNFGRLLNPKEAFRQLSYKFHGKQPGRKKQAKILQAYQVSLLFTVTFCANPANDFTCPPHIL